MNKYLDYNGVERLIQLVLQKDQELLQTMVKIVNDTNAQWNTLQPDNPND